MWWPELDWVYLHDKTAWDGQGVPLSSPIHLGLQNSPWFHIFKGCFGLVLWVEEPDHWGSGWHGVLGRAECAPRALAPTWHSPWGKAHRWDSAEAELSSDESASVEVKEGLLFTSAPEEMWRVKTHGTWWWLNQLCSSSQTRPGHSWSMASGHLTPPQLSLYCTDD